jgi:hypothetical protein
LIPCFADENNKTKKITNNSQNERVSKAHQNRYKKTIIGAVVGGLFIGVLNNGMSILGISTDWQQAIKGFVLLAAVAIDLYSKRKGGGK